ncbi:hypothetical protein BDN70DRAFT_871986 [Pholiota conissans]|uniref:Uncharacterized protein n=1 Tax=Pholiota conissans TaxID=109636 RepID=A0A9P5ZC59_9AGAR|nr:hypothetical protein BDN70DRAFT_871986 [Pholiota conissans]
MLKSCQMEYDSQRLTRIAEGWQAVHRGTVAERVHIVARFHAESCETPLRQELYRNAVAAKEFGSMSTESESDADKRKSMTVEESYSSMVRPILEEHEKEQQHEGVPDMPEHSISGLTLVDPPQMMSEEDETALFIREMDAAIKISLQEHERTLTHWNNI